MRQIRVPWGEERSRFTALYEALILDWLHQASIAGVAGMMGLSWDEVDGVMRRGVERGLERRQVEEPERLGVDETSFQKRHEYVTVVNDLAGRVLHVSDGHGKVLPFRWPGCLPQGRCSKTTYPHEFLKRQNNDELYLR